VSGDPIRPGDTVRLRSGGPAMTVVKKIPACWECVWFAGDERRSATFVELDLAAEPADRGDDESLVILASEPEDLRGPDSIIRLRFEDFDDLTRACL
jgi:uncharacterized protein YodC (DUF2158 family)